jgi:hypothetical protein
VMGSSLLITHEITLSRSSAVTVMVLRAYDHYRPSTSSSPRVRI